MKPIHAILSVFLTGLALGVGAQNISIATGGTGGVYYPLGGGMAAMLSKHVLGMQATVMNILVAHENMDGKTAYNIVKTIFDKRADLIAVHKEAENFKLENQKADASPIPLHPGAVKYFAEKGIEVALMSGGSRTPGSPSSRPATPADDPKVTGGSFRP